MSTVGKDGNQKPSATEQPKEASAPYLPWMVSDGLADRVRSIAVIQVARDAWCRASRRIVNEGRRAAAHPDEFVPWLESLAAKHLGAVTQTVRAAVDLVNAESGGRESAEAITGRFLEWARASLLEVADAKPSELAHAFDRWAAQLHGGNDNVGQAA